MSFFEGKETSLGFNQSSMRLHLIFRKKKKLKNPFYKKKKKNHYLSIKGSTKRVIGEACASRMEASHRRSQVNGVCPTPRSCQILEPSPPLIPPIPNTSTGKETSVNPLALLRCFTAVITTDTKRRMFSSLKFPRCFSKQTQVDGAWLHEKYPTRGRDVGEKWRGIMICR